MKIKINKRPEGNALLATMLIVFVAGMTLVSYLTMVSVQNQSTLRSQAWNSAIPSMEAGVEEALTALHYYDTNLVAGGWTMNSDGFYHTTGRLQNGSFQGSGYSYDVGIKPPVLGQNDQPIIECLGYAPAPSSLATSYGNPYYYGMILGGMVPKFTPDVPSTKRKVRVTTKRDPLFNKAMAAQGLIDMNGKFILTDSFDSTDKNYSTLGKYDKAKNRGNGDVASNGTLVNVANAGVMGKVSTGPGGLVNVQNGSVGSKAWVSKPTIGIEAGYAKDDMNVDFPPVTVPVPALTGSPFYSATVGGTNLLTGGALGSPIYFKLDTLSGKILVTGDVVIYVPATGTVGFSGQEGITLADGATLKLYVGAPSVSLAGNGVINPGSALNFQYFGLATNTKIDFNGNAAFTGSIYAPSAALTLGGGGNSIYDFVGSSITGTVTMNGHFKFHYDESLARLGPARDYIITSWNEVNPNN